MATNTFLSFPRWKDTVDASNFFYFDHSLVSFHLNGTWSHNYEALCSNSLVMKFFLLEKARPQYRRFLVETFVFGGFNALVLELAAR